MRKSKFTFTDELIQAYVDNELDHKTRKEFEENLVNKHDVAKQIETYLAYNDDLKKLFNPVLTEDIPEKLLTISYKQPAPSSYFAQAAVLLMTLGIGLMLGWFGNDQFRPVELISMPTNTETLVEDAFAYHVVFTPEIRHPVEVTADNQTHLFKWLSKRLDRQIQAPSLKQAGFELLGGRLLQTGEKPAAQFMYENSAGDRLTLFARQRMKTELRSSFRYAKQDGQNAFYWMDDNLSFVLIGGISKSKLSSVVHTLYNSMNI